MSNTLLPFAGMDISATLGNMLGMLPAPLVKQVSPMMGGALAQELPSRLMDYAVGALVALGLVAAGWVVSRWAMQRLSLALMRAHVNETVASFFGSVTRFLVLFGFVAVAVVQLGGSAQMLLAITGGLLVALGLGLKDTVSDVVCGVMILLNRPFEVGDYVQVAGHNGTVKRINIFQTELNTLDNARVFLPNRVVWESPLSNFTHNSVRMIEVKVEMDYSYKVRDFRAALLAALTETGAQVARILPQPAPFVGVHELGSNGIVLVVRVWVRTSDWVAVRFGVLEDIHDELRRRGLEVPFPQLVVHRPPAPAAVPKKAFKPARPRARSSRKPGVRR